MDQKDDSWEELAAERARLNRSLRRFELHHGAVSYTHLTLPTILRV